MAGSDLVRWLEDYADDLAGYRAMDVRLACAQWRSSDTSRMAAPGELVAKCRTMVDPSRIVLPPPAKSSEPIDPAERAIVGRQIRELAGSLRDLGKSGAPPARRQGETDVMFARRVWPDRERRPRGGGVA